MYNSSKRKQPTWLVLSVIIIILGGVLIWLLHNRHVKQEQLALSQTSTQVQTTPSSSTEPATAAPAPAPAIVTATQANQASADTASSTPNNAQNTASEAPDQAASPATANDTAQTIQDLQAQVQSLQQSLNQAQQQLQSGQNTPLLQRTQNALTLAKNDVAYLQDQVKQLKKQISNMHQLSSQNQDYVAKLQVENQKLRSLLQSHGIEVSGDAAADSSAADSGSQAAQDEGSGVPVVAIVSDVATSSRAESSESSGSAANALPAQVMADSGALNYRIDIAHLDAKVPVNTPVHVRYVLQYQLVTGQNVFQVIGQSKSTVQTVTRLQGQFAYPTAATPIKLRVVVTGPKGVMFDTTYSVMR